MLAATLLRRARRGAGLTQEHLARRSGVPKSVISAYENGRREPGADALLALLRATGTELAPQSTVERSRPQARQLERVCALAMEVPRRPVGDLTYPSFGQLRG